MWRSSFTPCFFFFLLFTASFLLSCDRRQLTAAAALSLSACNETSGRRCRVVVEEAEEQLGGGVDDVVEFQFDSEINRRLLAGQSNGIIYGTGNKDSATCKTSDGHPYNCAGKSGNPGGGRTCDQKLYRCGK